MKYCISGKKKGSSPVYLNTSMVWTSTPFFYKTEESAKNMFNSYSKSKRCVKSVKLIGFVSEGEMTEQPQDQGQDAFTAITNKLDMINQMKNEIEEWLHLFTQISIDKEIVSDFCDTLLSDCDKATTDVLHYIELNNFNASQGYAYAYELQKIRKTRRLAKDTLALLASFQQVIPNNDLRPLESTLSSQKERKYHPRIWKDKVSG